MITEYTEQDFQGMMFKVNEIPLTQDIFTYFPVLSKHKEFSLSVTVDRNFLLRYLFLVYDAKSPFRTIDDLNRMKLTVLDYLNINIKEEPEWMDYVLCKNDNFCDMIIRFCRMQNSPDFAELVIYKESYYEALRAQMGTFKTPLDEKNHLANTAKKKENIRELEKVFLVGDTSVQLLKQLNEEIEHESLDLRPEDIAEKISKGEDPLNGHKEYE